MFAADAVARLSGVVGVAAVTAGPGMLSVILLLVLGLKTCGLSKMFYCVLCKTAAGGGNYNRGDVKACIKCTLRCWNWK